MRQHARPGRSVPRLALTLAAALAVALTFAAARAQEAKPQGTHTLYLVRHGAYNEDDPRDPDVGKALIPLGREQAERVGRRLAHLGVKFDALHASTMTRARQTAEIVARSLKGMAPTPAPLLRECTPPSRRADVMADLKPGEADECRDQLEHAFARYFRPSPEADRHDILVCHGNVIRYLVCKVLEVDPTAWLGMTIANCSLTVVRVNADGSMRLVSYDDVGHLPLDLQTYTGQRAPAPGKVKVKVMR
jgi:serine/threonine-protein phosphatase PGAM5